MWFVSLLHYHLKIAKCWPYVPKVRVTTHNQKISVHDYSNQLTYMCMHSKAEAIRTGQRWPPQRQLSGTKPPSWNKIIWISFLFQTWERRAAERLGLNSNNYITHTHTHKSRSKATNQHADNFITNINCNWILEPIPAADLCDGSIRIGLVYQENLCYKKRAQAVRGPFLELVLLSMNPEFDHVCIFLIEAWRKTQTLLNKVWVKIREENKKLPNNPLYV